MQIDIREPQTQLDQARELLHTLAESAQKHNAMLAKEPQISGATAKDTAKQLPVEQGFFAGLASLVAIDSRGQPQAEPAESGAQEEDAASDKSTFDEQLIFVNANGAVLKNVGYEVRLADGSTHTGATDEKGRTARIVTDAPQAVQEIRLKAKESPGCCAVHAQNAGSDTAPITFAPQGVATNAEDVGSSTQQVPTPKGKSRGLTAGEIAMARQLFKDAIDYSCVKVHNGEYLWFGMQPNDTAMTPNGEMYFSPDNFKEDFAASNRPDRHWFMHEMVHVWQHQLGYPVKWRGAIRLGLSYVYELADDKTLADFNMEAQGDLLADFWVLKFEAPPHTKLAQPRYAQSLALFEKVLSVFIADPSNKQNLPGGE